MIDGSVVDAGGFGHAMLLYRDVQEHTSMCAEYLRAAAAAHSAVMIAGARRNLADIASSLGEAAGSVWLADLTDVGADPGRVLSMIRTFAREHAAEPVRFVQDVGWLEKPTEDLAEAVRYEALLCQALAGARAQVLCCYDARLDPVMLAAAERAHPAVLDQGRLRPSKSFAGNGSISSLPAQLLSAPPAYAKALVFRDDQVGARRFAEDEARRAGLPAHRIADLVIAVGEVTGNTLRHTDDSGTLTIWATDDEVICQVDDHGHIGDPLAGTIPPDPAVADSRRGLWLLHQVADLVQTRSGPSGTIMRVHLRLPRPRDGADASVDAATCLMPSAAQKIPPR